jgi:ABC-type xylose transport system substrate-binding protein
MKHPKRILTGALVAVAAAGAVASVAAVTDDGDNSVSGPDADRATATALRLTHGGTANSVERDSENGATWEVEVTRTDGTTVDVRLDENFRKVVIEGDSEKG